MTTYLKDYKEPVFFIDKVELSFDLHEENTIVKSALFLRKNPSYEENLPLILDGEELELISINAEKYRIEGNKLIVDQPPLKLEITNKINPKANTKLSGLYLSSGIFCTQNEPEGFRRITYFVDRPDVMAKYHVTIRADKKLYPVLLSNGNCLDKGDLEDGRHFATWEDPFAKPSYLFALVAGDLVYIQDSFKTKSGRLVDLFIYAEEGRQARCYHAMESLKRSMKWDEDRYGLEYDLDIFMIVVVDAFNAGAMENKGLNIFNTSCVLADPKSETDANFERVEGVIAHEYFHNWTGDRVTCRDWFQLTLKEGLTVYRDQEFSSDMNSRAVKRIEEVKLLKTIQFAEDASPMAHPIKPSSYIEINNFYTATVYDKGAEVIRMIEVLIGKELFRLGIDKYFELFDGKAVTTEDFVFAMQEASKKDLTQFKKWYSEAGTPKVSASFSYDAEKKRFTLEVKQDRSMHFPLLVALYSPDGKEIPLDEKQFPKREHGYLLEVKKEKELFVFEDVEQKPTLSLNRNFSSPIYLDIPYTLKDFAFLMRHDTDAFNRFEMGQELMTQELLKRAKDSRHMPLDKEFIEAFRSILNAKELDGSLKALMLTLPSDSILMEHQDTIDVEGNFKARKEMKRALSLALKEDILAHYSAVEKPKTYSFNKKDVATRAFANWLLSALASHEEKAFFDQVFLSYKKAENMTDSFAALSILSNYDCPQREEALSDFYHKWKEDKLVMMKWFSLQALSPLANTLETVAKLTTDPIYDRKTPNLVRALIGSFSDNHLHFHAPTGAGYDWVADEVLLMDSINPQIAARVCSGFKRYGKLDKQRKELMKKTLERVLAKKGLSNNVYEIISKCLQGN